MKRSFSFVRIPLYEHEAKQILRTQYEQGNASPSLLGYFKDRAGIVGYLKAGIGLDGYVCAGATHVESVLGSTEWMKFLMSSYR